MIARLFDIDQKSRMEANQKWIFVFYVVLIIMNVNYYMVITKT